ncbi:MAG: beta-eliminating lyase-related protein [Reinekea sp.]|nr:beta-eliminating lyase-related protein [Reinekea sp.]
METLIKAYRKAASDCRYSAARHTAQSLKMRLQALADAVDENEQADVYGVGALIEQFEQEVAALLGKEQALFLPSGTMAQPIALKIWAEQQRSPYVALHATSHLQLHEHNAYQTLYGLRGVTLGSHHRVPTLADIQSAAVEPLAAILLELPMREIGGQLPAWEDLVAQASWAREHNIKLHMDGARLWQCPPAYGKSLAEISALFDSVYVSFYKDLGGISGACLAGDANFIAQAKIWVRRAGGNLFSLAPYIVAAREGLKQHLPHIAARREQAIWLAEQLNQLPGVTTWPRVPQTNMFRVRMSVDVETYLNTASQWMLDNNVALITPPYETGEGYYLCEMTIGDAFAEQTPAEWQQHLARFAEQVLS